jgi:hypothetical protein
MNNGGFDDFGKFGRGLSGPVPANVQGGGDRDRLSPPPKGSGVPVLKPPPAQPPDKPVENEKRPPIKKED